MLMPSASSDSCASPSSPWSLLIVLAVILVVSSSESRERSSPISSESSRSCTASREAALVLDQLLQPVEIAPGALLDERAPQIDQLARGRRRREPGQALAHHHGDGFLDRRIGAVGDVVELAAMKLVVEHRGEVLRHAVHAPRADRLDARLLDRLEHRARLLAARHLAAVHRRIMAGELQRDRVGVPAHDRGVLRVELARRLGQPRLAAGNAGALRRVGDFEIRLARDRAHAARDRALERLGRRLLRRGFRFDVGGHLQSLRHPHAVVAGGIFLQPAELAVAELLCRTRAPES